LADALAREAEDLAYLFEDSGPSVGHVEGAGVGEVFEGKALEGVARSGAGGVDVEPEVVPAALAEAGAGP
jgi:hypothetical protein